MDPEALVSNQPVLPTEKTATAFRYAFFRSIEAAGADWDQAAPPDTLFLQRPYLSVLESNPPQGMRFGYLVFYQDGDPIGIAVCQIKFFKGDDNINEEEHGNSKDPCFFNGLAKWFKRWVAGKVAADILICGNMLLTGEHGFWFKAGSISPEASAELLQQALANVVATMEFEGNRIPVTLVKDLAPQRGPERDFLSQKGYTEFCIQPNMVMDLPYASFDDYLSAMSTKYRTRAKRAFKKANGIEKRELGLADIQRELPRIYALYSEIARNAGFNMVDLNENYIPALKRELPEQFRLFAYYLDGKLIAFFTTLRNYDELDAHYLGLDKHLNHEHQLYLNILYDIVRAGLDAGAKRIVFARTALEIKSSVGAVAEELYCYLRHQNSLANKFTGKLLDYLKPVEEWQPRHPFKHGADGDEIASE
ncbi:MAG TPA: GNAT family N-acetyltransferase [Saprospiraceae bacterium]|nr:GNAT family N-acetyltransferase [Saprospiraceae bacterium]